MIHSVRPTVLPVANFVFVWNLFYFEQWGRTDGRTDGRHVQKQLSLPTVTVGRPRGSIFMCYKTSCISWRMILVYNSRFPSWIIILYLNFLDFFLNGFIIINISRYIV